MASAPAQLIIDDELNVIPTVDCKYHSPASLSATMNSDINNSENNFSILALNIRSCRKNFISLTSFLNTFVLKFSIIMLVETWLSSETDYGFNLQGYKQYNQYRNNHGGGIKILYDELLTLDILEDYSGINDIFEVVAFYLCGKGFKYLISCVYRPPSSNPNEFNDLFFEGFFPV